MAKFEIYQKKSGEFYFRLKAGNGETILTSEGYVSKGGCKNGIESVKKNAKDEARFDRKESSHGKPFFNLIAGNNEIIGSSEMYEAVASRENGIKSVMKNAPSAKTVELE